LGNVIKGSLHRVYQVKLTLLALCHVPAHLVLNPSNNTLDFFWTTLNFFLMEVVLYQQLPLIQYLSWHYIIVALFALKGRLTKMLNSAVLRSKNLSVLSPALQCESYKLF